MAPQPQTPSQATNCSMAFEDVPTWYIRNKGVSEKYNGVSGKTCADAVWEKYE